MMTIEAIQAALQGRNLAEVARSLDMARPSLSLIRAGKIKPAYDTLVKLSDYLEERDV